jgi:hypothetical protein
MANILWIGNGTDVNWSTPANWQGGVVPDVANDDIAIFTSVANGGGSGNCTVDTNPYILGFKLLSDYAGTFNLNEKSLFVGKNGEGVFHVLKSLAYSASNTVNLYCRDIFIGATWQTQNTYHVDCDLRTGNVFSTGNTYLGTMIINAGVIVTLRDTPHPDYPSMYVFKVLKHNTGSRTINGTFDMSKCSEWNFTIYSGTPNLDFVTGTLKNTSENICKISGHTGNIQVGMVEGLFSMNLSSIYVGAATTANIMGDLRQFKDVIIVLTSTSIITYNMVGSIFNHLQLVSNTTQNIIVTLPETSEIYGNFIVTQTSTGAITLQKPGGGSPLLILDGTQNQTIEIVQNTTAMPTLVKSNKLGGKVTLNTSTGQNIQLSQSNMAPVAEYYIHGTGKVELNSNITTTAYTIEPTVALVDNGYSFQLVKDFAEQYRSQLNIVDQATLGFHSVRFREFLEFKNSVNVSPSTVKTYRGTVLGTGSATALNINHNLDSQEVIVQVYKNQTPPLPVSINWEHLNSNSISLHFATAPATTDSFIVKVLTF